MNNPDELIADEEDQDDDPEILEEIDKRQEEIIEEFLEMIASRKHDEREQISTEFEDLDDEDFLSQKLKECNKSWDKKKKEGREILRERLNNIVNDEELHASARLQKLYEESEIRDYME